MQLKLSLLLGTLPTLFGVVAGEQKLRTTTKNPAASSQEQVSLERSLVDINYNDWTFIMGENFNDQTPLLDKRLFREMVEAQDQIIVRRACPSCAASHQDIYYRRLTPMPTDFDLLDTLMNNWFNTNNVLNVDFSLHSTYQDAIKGTNGWTWCNYNDPGIGFPRDCGPTGRVNHQWNSYTRGGGSANTHAFLIPLDPNFESKLEYPLFPTVQANAYGLQVGTKFTNTGAIGWFDNNDYIAYPSLNFGDVGTTKGILINYSKSNNGGKLEIRLGVGTNGKLIGEFSPAHTGSWSTYQTAYVKLTDENVSGVQDITLVGKGVSGVMNYQWFELSDFSDRSDTHLRISASEYSDQSGTSFSNGYLGWFDNNDYVTYTNINFGSSGATDGMRISYAKSNDGGTVEIRLGGPTGTLIATFNPAHTGGWDMWMEAYVGITGITGVHDVTFVGKNNSGVMNLQYFELSKRDELFPSILATAFSTQSGVKSPSFIGWFDNGDYVTYSSLNFGSSGTTKSIQFSYSKASNGGTLEIRTGGPTGTLIATFSPQHTGSWDNYVPIQLPIDSVSGVHDLTFVAKDRGGVLNFDIFELSGKEAFVLNGDYKVNDDGGKDTQCNYEDVLDAYTQQVYNKQYSTSSQSAEQKFFASLGVSGRSAAKSAVSSLCGGAQAKLERGKISFDAITYEQGSQFVELHYAGRGPWNEETETNLSPGSSTSPANVLKESAYMVPDYKAKAERTVFEWPDLPQFDPSVCQARAAQCCWPRDRQANDNNGNCAKPYDQNCVDKDVADNTDLCYNDLDRAPYTNGINAKGFSTYDQEGPVHCHGFAWSTDDQEITSRYKANALFFVSMFDHMYQRGYVENIPGSPMCGCVEHMPVVTRSDCTQTNVQETYTFIQNDNGSGFTTEIATMKLQFQACQGANNKNNDLSAFVQQLVNDGKLTTAQQDIFRERVVGNNNCPTAIEDRIAEAGFQKGFEVNPDEWTFVVGESFEDQKPILDKRLFREMVEAQDQIIVRRACPSCVDSHKDIYYRRLTPMPADFDLMDTLMHNWFSKDNVLNVDFSLHSTYMDAYYGTNGWTFCNYDDPGIGFPRDCGPTGRVNFQWNSYTRNGGMANFHAFLIQADPDFESKIGYPVLPLVQAEDFGLQVGTRFTETKAIGWFDNNDYIVYPSLNFGDNPGTTKGILINYSKGNDGGRLEIRLGAGKNGKVIGEISPAHTGGWGAYQTAYVGLTADVTGVQDITFVGKGVSGVMNYQWFQLHDFSDRRGTHARIYAYAYSDQSGTKFGNKFLGWYDNNDYLTYSRINFGSPGDTDGIRIRYAKQNDGGRVEVRLGGSTGTLIATFTPAHTGGWGNYMEAYIGIKGITGVHDVTFVGKDASGVMNIEWFEPANRSQMLSRVLGPEFSEQKGIKSNNQITHYDKGDYVTYSNLNFGPSGTTNAIQFRYSKGTNGGTVEIRKGGPSGTVIGTFSPEHTGGWESYKSGYASINGIQGIHDLTFVAKGRSGVMNIKFFKMVEAVGA